jgi:23S rRNA (uridine2552-2'-O)-methyltransferase
VLAEHVGPQGRVVGVDQQEVEPLGGPVVTLVGDITEPELRARIAEALEGPADLILSDAAPKLSGIPDVDRAAMEELHEAALALYEEQAGPRACLIMKAFPGPEADEIRARLKQRFGRVSEVRPEAKRVTSKEFYWVAQPRVRR